MGQREARLVYDARRPGTLKLQIADFGLQIEIAD
jgi:hypothetical protein